MPTSPTHELIIAILADFEESYQDFLREEDLDDNPETRAQFTYAGLLVVEGDPHEDAVLQDAVLKHLRAEYHGALNAALRKNKTRR